MTTNLMVDFLIRYAVAGLIGRIVWLIISLGYIVIMTKMDDVLLNKCANEALRYESENSKKRNDNCKTDN